MKSKKSARYIYFFAFSAGFAFLVYELAWSRYLSVLLGGTVSSSAVVLASFLAGIGAGAYYYGKKSETSVKLHRALIFLSAASGITALLNFLLFESLSPLIFGQFKDVVFAENLLKFLAFIFLTVPAFFTGGIIPYASKIISYNYQLPESSLGKLYAAETGGSTGGALIAGFVLLGNIGLQASMISASLLYLLIALLLLPKLKQDKLNVPKEPTTKPDTKNSLSAKEASSSPPLALAASFLFGFSLIALQLIWIRIFKTYFTNTVYTFSLITASSVLGLSAGGFYFKKRASRIKSSSALMLRIMFYYSISVFIGLLILYRLPDILMFPLSSWAEVAFVRIIIIPLSASILLVIPPAFFSGFAFPLAWKMNIASRSGSGKGIGKVYLFNTAGSLLGPFVAAFLLIPFIGSGKSVLLIIALLLFGIFILNKRYSTSSLKILPKAALASALVFLFIAAATNKIRFVPPSVYADKEKLISYSENKEATVTVSNYPEKGVFGKSSFVNNSAVIGSDYDAVKVVKMVGHIPYFAGTDIDSALIIGFGVGITASAVASHPGIKQIDCVELVPGLKNLAKHYSDFNLNVARNPKLNFIEGDGRNYLQLTSRKYDLISCDPTHPVLGSGNLYTGEYFEQVRRHLKEGGAVSQYLPLHKLKKSDLCGIIKTFHSVFPEGTLWLGQYHAVLFARKNTKKIDFRIWEKRINKMPKDDFFYLEPYHIAANLVLDSAKISLLCGDSRMLSDDLIYTEFFSFNNFDSENLSSNLQFLSNNRTSISEVFKNIENPKKMNRFLAGNIKLSEALYFKLNGKHRKAVQKLKQASRLNPENQEIPFLLKLYYGQ